MRLLHFSLLWTLVIGHCCAGDALSRQWTSYSSPTKVASARDSYVKAAEHSTSLKDSVSSGDSSSGVYASKHPSSAFYYHLYPNSQAKYYGYSANKQFNIDNGIENQYLPQYYDDGLDQADSKTDPGTLASIAGVAISSISSLSWIGTALVAIALAPILIPVIIAPLIFIAIVIYFIPVIRLDLGAKGSGEDGRGLGGKLSSALTHLEATARFVQHVTHDEECVERLTCEIARMARGNPLENWINSKLDRFKSGWVTRVSRSYRAAKSGSDCKAFSCNPVQQFRRVVKSFGPKTKASGRK